MGKMLLKIPFRRRPQRTRRGNPCFSGRGENRGVLPLRGGRSYGQCPGMRGEGGRKGMKRPDSKGWNAGYRPGYLRPRARILLRLHFSMYCITAGPHGDPGVGTGHAPFPWLWPPAHKGGKGKYGDPGVEDILNRSTVPFPFRWKDCFRRNIAQTFPGPA